MAAAGLVAGVLLASACSGSRAAATATGDKPASEEVTKWLYAPDTAAKFSPNPGPIIKDPQSDSTFQLPYQNVLPVPDGPIGDPKKTYTICFSQALIRHPFAGAMKSSLMIEAARHPNLKILYYNTDNDALKQVQDLETCATQKPDAILVWPQSTAPLTPEISKLHKEGFLVIGMERTVATRDYDSWVYLDGKAQTKAVADFAGKLLNGKGTIAETGGDVGASATVIRHDGFAAALKTNYPNIKVITTPPTDFSAAKGFDVALQFLGSPSGQHIDAYYVHSGTTAFGIEKAMKQLGRTNIPIITIDGSKPEVQAVMSGEFAAVMPNNPAHADLALRLAIMKIDGQTIPKDVLLGVTDLITKDNAADWLPKAWGTPSGSGS